MGIISRLEVPARSGAARSLDNEDLRPVPRERRTWGFGFFNLFWFMAVGSVTNMLSGSSYLALGLSFWAGIGCTCLGYFIISIFMVLNGRAGSVYHIPFPVYARASWGVWGAGFPAANRAIMSIVWNGVNSVSGAQCIYVMLYACFPSIKSIPNSMSSGSALSSAEYICFFVFLAMTALILLLDVPKWSLLVYVKLFVYVGSALGMLGMVVHLAGGVGPVVSRGDQVQGSERAWLYVRTILTSAAGCSTFASNAADWQRNARKPNDPIIGQLLGFPLSNFCVQVVGMLIASTSVTLYGELLWNPVVYLQRLLEDDYTAGRRAGCFFIAGGFVYSLLFTCVFENIYCCGNDLSSLCPRFISIKRGFAICLVGTIVIQPQYLLGSASIFISVVASYQIFLFSIIAILMVHYYLIAKGKFEIEALYVSDKEGTYHYWHGINLRAVAAYLFGVALNFAGFLQNLGVVADDNERLRHSYYFSILTTTFGAGAVYYILCKIYPQSDYQPSWSEPKGIWEPSTATSSIDTTTNDDEKLSVDDLDKGDEIVARTIEVPELRS